MPSLEYLRLSEAEINELLEYRHRFVRRQEQYLINIIEYLLLQLDNAKRDIEGPLTGEQYRRLHTRTIGSYPECHANCSNAQRSECQKKMEPCDRLDMAPCVKCDDWKLVKCWHKGHTCRSFKKFINKENFKLKLVPEMDNVLI